MSAAGEQGAGSRGKRFEGFYYNLKLGNLNDF
jgi:hypothetical protein